MSELLNLVGLGMGIVLYAMLLAMVVRVGGRDMRTSIDPVMLATALLGLAWNLCALPVYELPNVGIVRPLPLLIVIGYSALGFLPAVAVQSVLRGEPGRLKDVSRWVVGGAAYAVAAAATGMHLWAAWTGDALPSSMGMQLLTYGFIALVIPLAIVTRGQLGTRRALWAAALSIFAVSALHLSQLHQDDASWPIELLGHHASVPLALAILYQDYPFALADLFLKRALTLVTLVASSMVSVAAVGAIHSPETPLRDPRDVGLLVTLWVGTALLYPRLRRGIGWFVDSVILHRPDYAHLRARIARQAQRQEDLREMLDDACRELRPALSANVVRWREGADGRSESPGVASVEIPVAESPQYVLEISDLVGGRRLFSDDFDALDAIAAVLGRRIDAMRLARERTDHEVREQEIGRLATEAELKALRAQINPHFLFNALTTIGYLIQTTPARALETLMRLTSLLRSVLRSEGEFTTLGRELELVEAYLDIERARFEHRLRVRVDVPLTLRHIRVPPLVLQPVVENAVKHGIAPHLRGGDVMIDAKLEGDALVLVVHDTGVGSSALSLASGRQNGVGLSNIERRLAVQYGSEATLSIASEPNAGTIVTIRLPARVSTAQTAGTRSAS